MVLAKRQSSDTNTYKCFHELAFSLQLPWKYFHVFFVLILCLAILHIVFTFLSVSFVFFHCCCLFEFVDLLIVEMSFCAFSSQLKPFVFPLYYVSCLLRLPVLTLDCYLSFRSWIYQCAGICINEEEGLARFVQFPVGS